MLQPLTPAFVERIWGSLRLEPWFADQRAKIGEVWFSARDRVPLLVKFLFTTERLSVQVHPKDAYARTHHDSSGKTEMWYILDAAPGAVIALGFREPFAADRVKAACLDGSVVDLLNWRPVQPGDAYLVPAGTVHAIGAGITLCEIQQFSDITYRLYDYGRPRELHLEDGMNVADLGPYTPPHAPAGTLAVCPNFVVERFAAGATIPKTEADQLVMVTRGTGALDGHSVRAGQVFLAPGAALATSGNCEVLSARVPSAAEQV